MAPRARALATSGSGRCGQATDQKAVRTRGPGRVVLGSKPQLATTEKLVRWAGEQAAACDCQKSRALGYVSSRCERVHSGGVNGVTAGGGGAAEGGAHGRGTSATQRSKLSRGTGRRRGGRRA